MKRRFLLNREFISSLPWIAVGLVFSVGGLRYGVFYAGGPGPGFLAFLGGIVLSSLGLVILISAVLPVKDRKEENETEAFFPEKDSFRKVSFAVLGLCLYAAVFEYLGFSISTLLIMVFLLRFIEPLKWTTVLITAILTAISFYLIFQVALKIPFPRGILGV